MDSASAIVKNQLQKLPPELRALILSSELEKKMGEIGKKYGLHIDQLGKLDNETTLTLLGLSGLDDYTERIQQATRIEPEKARQITADVNQSIFLPIQKSLQKLIENEWRESGESRDQKTRRTINNVLIEPATLGVTASTMTPPTPTQPPRETPASAPMPRSPVAQPTQPQPGIRTPQPIPPRPVMPAPRPIVPVPSMTSAGDNPVADLRPTPKPHVPWPIRTEAPVPRPALKVPQNFMEMKLAGEVSIPTQNISVTKSPEAPIKKSTTDPYREPIQ